MLLDSVAVTLIPEDNISAVKFNLLELAVQFIVVRNTLNIKTIPRKMNELKNS